MNRENVITFATKSHLDVYGLGKDFAKFADTLERFAALVQDEKIRHLHQICRDIYEVWAGSEGIPVPQTAPEAYLLQLVEQMRDLAKEGLK